MKDLEKEIGDILTTLCHRVTFDVMDNSPIGSDEGLKLNRSRPVISAKEAIVLAVADTHIPKQELSRLLPKKKEEYDQTIDDEAFGYEANDRNIGYNKAIDDFRKALGIKDE